MIINAVKKTNQKKTAAVRRTHSPRHWHNLQTAEGGGLGGGGGGGLH